MGLLGDIARAIMGPQPDPDDSPVAEDRDTAQSIDELIQSDDDWQVGEEIGTIPYTPYEGEFEETDPNHPSVRPEPWYRKFF